MAHESGWKLQDPDSDRWWYRPLQGSEDGRMGQVAKGFDEATRWSDEATVAKDVGEGSARS